MCPRARRKSLSFQTSSTKLWLPANTVSASATHYAGVLTARRCKVAHPGPGWRRSSRTQLQRRSLGAKSCRKRCTGRRCFSFTRSSCDHDHAHGLAPTFQQTAGRWPVKTARGQRAGFPLMPRTGRCSSRCLSTVSHPWQCRRALTSPHAHLTAKQEVHLRGRHPSANVVPALAPPCVCEQCAGLTMNSVQPLPAGPPGAASVK